MSAPVELRPFEVDRDAPFERFEARDRAPGWVVFLIAFGLVVAFIAVLVALIASNVAAAIEVESARLGALTAALLIVAVTVVVDWHRGTRIQAAAA